MPRKPYKESWAVFSGSANEPPALIHHRPRYDVVEGLDLLRAELTGKALESLTLPHIYCCRSLVESVSFRGSDLSQSVLVWSDFGEVDFSEAILRDSDLRNSGFERCRFIGADLEGCDLRCSDFIGCSFEGARMSGAVLSAEQLKGLPLSEEQRKGLRIDTPDPAPGG